MVQGVGLTLIQGGIGQQTDEVTVAAVGGVDDDLLEAVSCDLIKNVEIQLDQLSYLLNK